MKKENESDNLAQEEDFERILGSIERLESTIETFNRYVFDLKKSLEGCLNEGTAMSEFSSLEEYSRYKAMTPISEDEVKNMNIDTLLKDLINTKK